MYSLFVIPVNHVSQETLTKKFSEFGEIKDVYIPLDYNTCRRRGFAIIKFFSKDAALTAIEKMNDSDFYGKKLVVRFADDPVQQEHKICIDKQEDDNKENQKPFHELYRTAVSYPNGVGIQYTPIWQRGILPVGQRKTFFTWAFIPLERVRKILEDEEIRKNCHSKARPQLC